MSPILLKVLNTHEYWRKAWEARYIEYRRPNNAMKMLHLYRHDTKRFLRGQTS